MTLRLIPVRVGLGLFAGSLLATGLASTVHAGAPASPPRYYVTVLPADEAFQSAFPSAIDSNGRIAGYAAPDRFEPAAIPIVVDRESGVQRLSMLTDSQNFPLGMNDAGFVVGTSGLTPVYWNGGDSGPLPPPPGYTPGFGYDVNSAGVICGSLLVEFPFFTEYGCYWPSASTEGILLVGLTGANDSFPKAINDAGQIAGASPSLTGNFQGARWDDPTLPPVQVGPLPDAEGSELVAMNELGDTVGRSIYPGFLYEAMLHIRATDTLVGLGFLGDGSSFATGVNDARQVVGNASNDFVLHGFLWQEGELYDVNTLVVGTSEPISHVQSAVAINNAGQIAAEVAMSDEMFAPVRIALLDPVPGARGDLDCNGAVNFDDVDPFVLALVDFNAYRAAYPSCHPINADVNCDWLVNFDDIDPFVICLIAGCEPCPEPS